MLQFRCEPLCPEKLKSSFLNFLECFATGAFEITSSVTLEGFEKSNFYNNIQRKDGYSANVVQGSCRYLVENKQTNKQKPRMTPDLWLKITLSQSKEKKKRNEQRERDSYSEFAEVVCEVNIYLLYSQGVSSDKETLYVYSTLCIHVL